METPNHIQVLKNQIASIDKRIINEKLNHRELEELQELLDKKEAQIKRLEYLNNISYKQMNNTRHLLGDMVELMEGEYAHVKDEVEDIYQIVLAKLEEFEEEQTRRFT